MVGFFNALLDREAVGTTVGVTRQRDAVRRDFAGTVWDVALTARSPSVP